MIVDLIQVAKVVHRYKVVVVVLANPTATWVEAANVYQVASVQTLQLQLHPRPFYECKRGQKDTLVVVMFQRVTKVQFGQMFVFKLIPPAAEKYSVHILRSVICICLIFQIATQMAINLHLLRISRRRAHV